MRTIPKGSIKGKKAYLLQVIDFRFNKLTSLSDDFRSTTLPYITNMDLSYNCFTEVPPQPLNSAVLRAFAINHQRDEKTDQRCLQSYVSSEMQSYVREQQKLRNNGEAYDADAFDAKGNALIFYGE